MNKHLFMEASEEGKKLDLTYELEHLCQLVYKKSEDGKGYVFAESWNPETDYSEEHLIVPLKSVFEGTFNYSTNDVFANVIGSTSDPCSSSSSWIQLFRDKKIKCDSCVMEDCFYDSKDKTAKTYFTDYHCGGGIIGGHVVKGTKAQTLPKGSIVYLMPICHNHNSCCTDTTGQNGSGFFMMPQTSGKGIRLKGYFQ